MPFLAVALYALTYLHVFLTLDILYYTFCIRG